MPTMPELPKRIKQINPEDLPKLKKYINLFGLLSVFYLVQKKFLKLLV